MILYFSATGNSKAVAEAIAERLGDTAVDMIVTNPQTIETEGEEYLGLVFPIFAWAAPEAVLQFAQRLRPAGAFTFAVCTFSNVAGQALTQLGEILPLQAGYGLVMPDNFPVFDKIVETEETARQKLAAAKPRLAEICERLLAKEPRFDVLEGKDAQNRTYEKSKYFNLNQRKTEDFWVEDTLCSGCGICAQVCPAKAVQIQGGLPVWVKESCFLCAACLNRCPTEAIQYGAFSKGKFRYVFTGFDRA